MKLHDDVPLLLDLEPDFERPPLLPPSPAPARQLPLPSAPSLLGAPLNLPAWLLDQLLIPAFRPLRALLNVWQWADRHVTLSGRGTGRAGPYRSATTPWTRRFQEILTDPRAKEHHIIKSSRTGFTEAAFNMIRYMPTNAPGPVLFAIHSDKQGVNSNKNRLLPTLEGAIDDPLVNRRTDVTGAMIRLPNMVIKITGSYNESAFRSDGYRLVIGDEIEVVSEISEAGTLHDLMRSRIRGVPDSRLVTMSKPLRWCSAHHREVVTGTLEAYLVPCPHCGTFQELTMHGESPTKYLRIEQPLSPGQPAPSPPLAREHITTPLGRLRYDHCRDLTGAWDFPRILAETYYECVNGCHITGREPLDATHAWIFPGSAPGPTEVRTTLLSGKSMPAKHAMMLAGQWFGTNPRPMPGKRSGHIWDIVSHDEDSTWGHLALEHARALSDPVALSTFYNERLGLPYRLTHNKTDESALYACRSNYHRGVAPFRPDIILIGADTQAALQKYVTIAVRIDGPDYEVAVINWGIAHTPAEMIAHLATPIPIPPSPTDHDAPCTMLPRLALVDAGGNRTDQVYDLHLAEPRIIPCFGRPEPHVRNTTIWKGVVKHQLRDINIYFVADALLKRRLYHGMIAKIAEIKVAYEKRRTADGPPLSALGLPPRLHLPRYPEDIEFEEFKNELLAEELDEKGYWRKKTGHKNDYGDALKYALAAWDYIAPAFKSP